MGSSLRVEANLHDDRSQRDEWSWKEFEERRRILYQLYTRPVSRERRSWRRAGLSVIVAGIT